MVRRSQSRQRSLDSYGMTNVVFIDNFCLEAESAARLERKSFFALTQFLFKLKKKKKKDWERKADKAAQT